MKLRTAFVLLLMAVPALAAEPGILIKSGDVIGFMGDSITAQGNAPNGYIGLTISALKTEGIDAKAIPAGVPGHTLGAMKPRVKPQILDKNANWMTLNCGVNDARLNVTPEEFKKNLATMVEACEAKKCGVILLTPTPFGEDLDHERNKKVIELVDVMRAYAKEKNLRVADLYAAFTDYYKTPLAKGETAGSRLTVDSVHPNQAGQTLMARTLLLTLGVPAKDMPKIESAWLNDPRGKQVKIGQKQFVLISQRQFNALEAQARETHKTPQAVVAELWKRALADSKDDEKAAQDKVGPIVDAYLAGSAK